jgi:glycosyltransferase involved in cell wall biosynthesis
MIPTVTIIMPAHNSSQYLPESIESVLAQTFQNFELLVIDDGSIDNTVEIVRSYIKQDSRVKLISQTNQGVSATRNRGIYLSVSEYVAFIDADDKWFPEKLSSHLESFKSDSNLGISFARVEFISPEGKATGIATARLTKLKPQHFLYENPTITVSNLVIRQKVFQDIGCFDTSMNYAEDLDLLLRVITSNKWKIEGLNRVLMAYRTTTSGLSSNLYCMEEGWETLAAKAKEYAPDLIDEHYLRARSIHLRYLARRALRLRFPSKVGVDFMTRGLMSDSQMIFKEPRRTILTMLAVYTKYFLTRLIS